VKAQLLVPRRNQFGFHRGEHAEALIDQRRAAGACGIAPQAQIKLEMARFGAPQGLVECAEWGRQARREQCEALAGARLDERTGEQ
jgi:hypothetical protein